MILYLATSTNFESQLPEDTQQEIAKGPPRNPFRNSTGDATVGFGKGHQGRLFPPVLGMYGFFGAPLDKIGYCLFP